MMSGELGKLSTTSQSAFSKMSQSAQAMTNRNQVLGLSFNELQKKIHEVENTIKSSTIPSQISAARRELAILQRQSTRHAGNVGGGSSSTSSGLGIGGVAIGSMLGGFAVQAGTAIIGAVGSGIGTMVSKSMEKEQAITGLTTFLGKDGANEAYKNIRQDANVTPFDTASLLEVNRALISAGANAKDARSDTMNLANAVSAVGGGNDILSRMAANMQQIKTVGKATAMDIRQFGIAGINIYEMLARSTGKNINQVKEMEVSYADLSKAMAMANSKGGIYEGAMAAQSKTMSGKWSTVKDNFSTAASDIGDAFSPVFNKLLDLGIKFANSIGPALEKAQPLIASISSGVSMVVDSLAWGINNVMTFANWLASGSTGADVFTIAVGALATGFLAYQGILAYTSIVTGIATAKQWLLNAALTANPIGIVIVAIAALIGAVAVAYMKFEKFRAVVDGVWETLKAVWEIYKAIFTGKWASIPILIKQVTSGETFKKGYDNSLLESKAAKIKATKDKADQLANDKKASLTTGTKLATSNAESSKKTGDTVSGGGPRIVNIHVGKFFDNLQFTTLNSGESAQQIENLMMECLARVVYNGSKLA